MEDQRTDAEKIADFHAARAAEAKTAEKLTTPSAEAAATPPSKGGESSSAASPEPNLAFVGKREAPRSLTDGFDKFELPEDQSEPFHHPDAARIARAFPRLYKRFVKKGE